MSFTVFRPTALNLSLVTLLHVSAVSTVFAQSQPNAGLSPNSAYACSLLTANIERLNCYDTLFKTTEPTTESTTVTNASNTRERGVGSNAEVQEADLIALQDDAATATASKHTSRVAEKIKQKLNPFFALDNPDNDFKDSLLDSRWELSPNSKLGTWNLRAYQPVYLLPIYWTTDKNKTPQSPNPLNTVPQDEALELKSSEAKFQISFKTKALESVFGGYGDLWVGYTQSSRWQVYNEAESRPFRETNYEPEASLIFGTDYRLLGLDGRLLGVTFNHQSNGRSDPLSRSWNRVIFNLGFERDNFALMLRPWYRIPENGKDDNNPDISDYIGRGDLTAFYRWNQHEYSLMLRHSLRDGARSHGAMQFDWAFPIRNNLRGHVQLFDGYGESMIDYNHRAFYVGLGVSLMNWF